MKPITGLVLAAPARPRRGVVLALTLGLLAACGPAPAGAPATAAGENGASSEWDRLVAEARREGSVRISVPAGVPGLGEAFASAFDEAYGIRVDSTSELS